MSPAARTWSSIYVFLHRETSAVDTFLMESVLPAADTLRESGVISDWYFLRYWEGGPHLRIRLADASSQIVADLAARWADDAAVHRVHSDIDPAEFYSRFEATTNSAWHLDGDVIVERYEPETERYGGPAAVARAESFFCESARLALSIIANTRNDMSKRLAIAADLLLIALDATAWPDEHVVREARRYYYSWDYSGEVLPWDASALRAHADALFEGSADQWAVRWTDLAATALLDGDHAYAIWARCMRAYLTDLRRLAASQPLSSPIERIFWSQVHMFHNRLAVSIDDERMLAWLMSRIASARYFARGQFSARADLTYLETSKYGSAAVTPVSVGAEGPDSVQVGHRSSISLIPKSIETSFADAMSDRRSSYGSYAGSLELADVSTLLTWSAGTVAPGRLAYASPGKLQPTDVVVLARSVDGLPPGMYRFDAGSSTLQRTPMTLDEHSLLAASPYFSSEENPRDRVSLDRLPAVVFLVVHLERLRGKYGERSLRLALLEAGQIAQNLALCSSALGLASVHLSGFQDDLFAAALHLDGLDQFVVSVIPIGGQRSFLKK